VPRKIQMHTLRRLDHAYRAFFRRTRIGQKPGFPRFKSIGRFKAFGFSEFTGIQLQGSRLRFAGMPGQLRIRFHRALPIAPIRRCLFRRDVKGWTINFVVEVEAGVVRCGDSAIGVDLGITTFAMLSNGQSIRSLRATRRTERALRRANRALCRKKPDSRGRWKMVRTLARLHAKTAASRRNHLHQTSSRLTRDFELVAIEALRVKALARTSLAKDVHDASWGTFISMLRYKAERAGTRLIEVDARNTSQTCSNCGAIGKKTLSDRIHGCDHCNLYLDRDLNAARNILRLAGVGRGLHNVAPHCMRAGETLGCYIALSAAAETLPILHFPPVQPLH